MIYDEWKTRSDLDDAPSYPITCMVEGCPNVVGESSISGSTGLCDDHLETLYPLEPVWEDEDPIFTLLRDEPSPTPTPEGFDVDAMVETVLGYKLGPKR